MTVPGPFTMSQQAQNDFYRSPAEAAMDYAKAVNDEIRDLFAAGADVVQIDEPYMQARPQAAREYGLEALEAALEGVKGTTAVHICFGYAAIIHARPEGYSFLPEFEQCRVHQVSIETAQSNLDTAILEKLPDKTIVLGVIDLDNMAVETPEIVASRVTRAFPHCPPERIIVAPDCGMKYLPREVAYGKMVSMVKGAALVREALETARSAVDKSKKRKAAMPEIRTASGGSARTAPRPAARSAAKSAKAVAKAKPKTKVKAAKKR
jgi:5-methyltetrahydropteroyltriglutamate--homocysteine methyltransferase